MNTGAGSTDCPSGFPIDRRRILFKLVLAPLPPTPPANSRNVLREPK